MAAGCSPETRRENYIARFRSSGVRIAAVCSGGPRYIESYIERGDGVGIFCFGTLHSR